MEINAVIFDLDNTLYREAEYLCLVVRNAFAELGISVPVDPDLCPEIIERKIDRRKNDILANLFLFFTGRPPNEEEHNTLFKWYSSLTKGISLFEDAEVVLGALKGKVKAGLLTNGNPIVQKNKIKILGLESIMNDIVVAPSGTPKPSKEAFLLACERLSVKPSQCLMVGDDPINDINGARSVGMASFRVMRGFFRSIGSNADKEGNELFPILDMLNINR